MRHFFETPLAAVVFAFPKAAEGDESTRSRKFLRRNHKPFVPSGMKTNREFTNPPLIDIAFEDGKVVIKTPPVVNSDGVTVSVVESSDVAGKTVTATKAVDASGSTEFTKSAESPRFYRLSAEVTE